MNTASLARHFDALTPWERLPLLVAAQVREDEVEHDRLARSAPKHLFHVPDYWGLVEGFEDLATLYVLRQLDSAAFCWRLMAFLEQGLLFDDKKGRRQPERLWKMIKLETHKFVVRADGWKLLCAELQVAPDFMLRQLPGNENVCRMEGQARLLAFSAEEAVSYLRELFERVQFAKDREPPVRREYRLDTATDVARSMREALNERLASWT
jgi:hypothetical protein